MKLKYHKIKNIPLEVCTAEQKIAYNLALSNIGIFEKSYNKCMTGIQKSSVVSEAVNLCMNQWVNDGSIEFVNIVDEVETYEVEKTVKRPVKPDVSVEAAAEIGKYTVNEDVDTRDQSKIWVVKIVETLDKEAFNVLRGKMKELGGYYSRFKKGFLFRDDPTEELNNVFA